MKKKILIGIIVAVFLALTAVCVFKLPEMQKYTKGDEKIKGNIENIKIECEAGKITVSSTPRAYFSLEEKPSQKNDSDKTIEWLVTGKTLRIRCNPKDDREYVIGVPKETVLDDLDIKGKSIGAQISDITVRDLTLRTESGSILIEKSKCVDALIAETDSADIQIDGTFARRFDIETESGKAVITAPSFQRDCRVVTNSGDISIEAIEDSRLNIIESHGKGSFTSAFESAPDGEKLSLKTRSGKIEITAYSDPADNNTPDVILAEQTTSAPAEIPSEAEKETAKKS